MRFLAPVFAACMAFQACAQAACEQESAAAEAARARLSEQTAKLNDARSEAFRRRDFYERVHLRGREEFYERPMDRSYDVHSLSAQLDRRAAWKDWSAAKEALDTCMKGKS